MSRDPAKSRPLSENVKRMMWLERAAPRNQNVLNAQRVWTENTSLKINVTFLSKYETCVKISTLHLTVLIQSAII